MIFTWFLTISIGLPRGVPFITSNKECNFRTDPTVYSNMTFLLVPFLTHLNTADGHTKAKPYITQTKGCMRYLLVQGKLWNLNKTVKNYYSSSEGKECQERLINNRCLKNCFIKFFGDVAQFKECGGCICLTHKFIYSCRTRY